MKSQRKGVCLFNLRRASQPAQLDLRQVPIVKSSGEVEHEAR